MLNNIKIKVKENIEQGKLKYKEYKEASRSDKTGTCWASAIEVSLLVKMSGGSFYYSITCLKSREIIYSSSVKNEPTCLVN